MGNTAGRRGSVGKDRERGTYYVVVDVNDVGAPRRQIRRRGYRTERDANTAITEILRELDANTYIAPDPNTTLADYVTATWLPALRVRHRKPATLESYERNLRVHVLPRLGHKPLSSVSHVDLDRLYADLLAGSAARKPLAPRTVRYIHTILHGVFAHAVLKGHLSANPAQRADAPEPRACRSRVMTTWTAEQLRTFLTALPQDRFYAPLFLLATTGMRLGEVLGMQWADIRLDDAELDVRRTLGLIAGQIGRWVHSSARSASCYSPQQFLARREPDMNKQEDIAAFLADYVTAFPRTYGPYRPSLRRSYPWASSRPTAEEIAREFLSVATFRALKLGTWLGTTDGQIVVDAVEMVVPMFYVEDVELLVEALQIAAALQQREGRGKALAGAAFALVVIGLSAA